MISPPPLEPVAAHSSRTVAVIGAGSIGIAWAVVFASAGVAVRLFETDEAVRLAALGEVESVLAALYDAGLMAEPVADMLSRVSMHETLAATVAGADFVQECVIEDIEVKRALFAELDSITPPDVVLASSTSTIMASLFAADVPGRQRCLVVHPANPPYFLRVAEIVPASFTSAQAIESARELLTQVDVTPVVLNREIEGFAFNRLQGAMLREAYCLVRDGILSATDLDTLVREGLGLRWSVIGPFTTSELNTRGGIRRHAEVIGPVYARIGVQRGSDDPWTPETIEQVASEIEQRLPHPTWEENVRERDLAMIRLASLLRHFENPLSQAARAASTSTM
jgi:3-hydroxyacyl-CoA dehydrogenase